MSLILVGHEVLCAAQPVQQQSLPTLPDVQGWAGMYAGVAGGQLLAAGGAQFPGKKPWEGGAKEWTDRVFHLAEPTGQWQQLGRLPRPLGYGGSVTLPAGLLCLGGSDAAGHYADCFLLQITAGNKLSTEPWPALPVKLANHAAVLMGQQVYVLGGSEEPGSLAASAKMWRLSLTDEPRGWQPLPACPGRGRIYPAVAVVGERLFVFGGIALQAGAGGKPQRDYLQDAWSYSEKEGWLPLPALPRALAAGPCPAPVLQGRVLLAGGDDGSRVDYLPKEQHPGFGPAAWWYLPELGKYEELALQPVCVTCPTVRWRDYTVRVSGELRPAVRTPTVVGWRH